jgi:hypothetical protein
MPLLSLHERLRARRQASENRFRTRSQRKTKKRDATLSSRILSVHKVIVICTNHADKRTFVVRIRPKKFLRLLCRFRTGLYAQEPNSLRPPLRQLAAAYPPGAATTVCPGKRAFFFLEDRTGRTRGTCSDKSLIVMHYGWTTACLGLVVESLKSTANGAWQTMSWLVESTLCCTYFKGFLLPKVRGARLFCYSSSP